MKEPSKKKYQAFVFILGLSVLIGAINTFQYYKQFRITRTNSKLTTYGIVTGFSSGGRWVTYFAEWRDQNGLIHNISNKNVNELYPNIGDTIEVIYNQENPKEAVINNYNETEGGFYFSAKTTSFLFLLFIISLIVYKRAVR